MKRTRSRKGAPGIIEVAARAQVSPATVSRYYNNPEIVSLTRKKRIEKAAQDLGYIRDRLAGSLHNHFSGTVGLVVPTIDNAIFSEMVEAFATQLRKRDRSLLIATHGYDMALEVGLVRSLLERRIDGVALIGRDHDEVSIDMLQSRDVPLITVWNYHADSPLPCIGADNFDAGYRVTNYLIERGHRDIGLIFPETDANDRARDRLSGAKAALAEAGLELNSNRLFRSTYDVGNAKATALKMLNGSARNSPLPTAIVCANDVIALGVSYACQALGLSIPADLSLIAIGDFSGSAHMEPGLTTLRMPATRIGTEAAEAICKMIDGVPSRQPLNQCIHTEIAERQSVRRL